MKKNIKLYRWSPVQFPRLSPHAHHQWVRRMVLRDLGMNHAEFGTFDSTETLMVMNAVAWCIGRRKYVTQQGIEEAACHAAADLIQPWRRGFLRRRESGRTTGTCGGFRRKPLDNWRN